MSARLRVLSFVFIAVPAMAAGWSGCATVPEPKFDKFSYPKGYAFVGDVQRPYTALGPVRSKVDYGSLDPSREEKMLCHNYYNKSVRELVRFAKKQGADAVINVESVVFLEDGRRETYKTPECSDDGSEGQILTQGIAVKWKKDGAETGAWTDPAAAPVAVAKPKRVPVRSVAAAPVNATAAAAVSSAPTPSATLAPVPAWQEGVSEFAKQTPEFPEPKKTAASTAAAAVLPKTAPVSETAAVEPDEAPVKVKLEDYDAAKSSQAAREPATASAPTSTPAKTDAAQSPSRPSLADPRMAPSALRGYRP
jgi:hypothetical protein